MLDKTGYSSFAQGDCCKSNGMGSSSAVLGILKMTTGFSFLWTFREVFVTGVCV